MSLLDDHVVKRADETWALPDDPEDEALVTWPEDERGPGPGVPA
jgi:hypothetical protein